MDKHVKLDTAEEKMDAALDGKKDKHVKLDTAEEKMDAALDGSAVSNPRVVAIKKEKMMWGLDSDMEDWPGMKSVVFTKYVRPGATHPIAKDVEQDGDNEVESILKKLVLLSNSWMKAKKETVEDSEDIKKIFIQSVTLMKVIVKKHPEFKELGEALLQE